MEIEVNGESKEILEQTHLKLLVDSLLEDTRGMAIAINNSVIPKTLWETTVLQQADKVLFIKATQGG